MQHKIGYKYRIENITFEDAAKRVLDRLGFIKTKPGIGMMWTKRTKSTCFLGERGGIRAIYNHTVKDFWWLR